MSSFNDEDYNKVATEFGTEHTSKAAPRRAHFSQGVDISPPDGPVVEPLSIDLTDDAPDAGVSVEGPPVIKPQSQSHHPRGRASPVMRPGPVDEWDQLAAEAEGMTDTQLEEFMGGLSEDEIAKFTHAVEKASAPPIDTSTDVVEPDQSPAPLPSTPTTAVPATMPPASAPTATAPKSRWQNDYWNSAMGYAKGLGDVAVEGVRAAQKAVAPYASAAVDAYNAPSRFAEEHLGIPHDPLNQAMPRLALGEVLGRDNMMEGMSGNDKLAAEAYFQSIPGKVPESVPLVGGMSSGDLLKETVGSSLSSIATAPFTGARVAAKAAALIPAAKPVLKATVGIIAGTMADAAVNSAASAGSAALSGQGELGAAALGGAIAPVALKGGIAATKGVAKGVATTARGAATVAKLPKAIVSLRGQLADDFVDALAEYGETVLKQEEAMSTKTAGVIAHRAAVEQGAKDAAAVGAKLRLNFERGGYNALPDLPDWKPPKKEPAPPARAKVEIRNENAMNPDPNIAQTRVDRARLEKPSALAIRPKADPTLITVTQGPEGQAVFRKVAMFADGQIQVSPMAAHELRGWVSGGVPVLPDKSVRGAQLDFIEQLNHEFRSMRMADPVEQMALDFRFRDAPFFGEQKLKSSSQGRGLMSFVEQRSKKAKVRESSVFTGGKTSVTYSADTHGQYVIPWDDVPLSEKAPREIHFTVEEKKAGPWPVDEDATPAVGKPAPVSRYNVSKPGDVFEMDPEDRSRFALKMKDQRQALTQRNLTADAPSPEFVEGQNRAAQLKATTVSPGNQQTTVRVVDVEGKRYYGTVDSYAAGAASGAKVRMHVITERGVEAMDVPPSAVSRPKTGDLPLPTGDVHTRLDALGKIRSTFTDEDVAHILGVQYGEARELVENFVDSGYLKPVEVNQVVGTRAPILGEGFTEGGMVPIFERSGRYGMTPEGKSIFAKPPAPPKPPLSDIFGTQKPAFTPGEKVYVAADGHKLVGVVKAHEGAKVSVDMGASGVREFPAKDVQPTLGLDEMTGKTSVLTPMTDKLDPTVIPQGVTKRMQEDLGIGEKVDGAIARLFKQAKGLVVGPNLMPDAEEVQHILLQAQGARNAADPHALAKAAQDALGGLHSEASKDLYKVRAGEMKWGDFIEKHKTPPESASVIKTMLDEMDKNQAYLEQNGLVRSPDEAVSPIDEVRIDGTELGKYQARVYYASLLPPGSWKKLALTETPALVTDAVNYLVKEAERQGQHYEPQQIRSWIEDMMGAPPAARTEVMRKQLEANRQAFKHLLARSDIAPPLRRLMGEVQEGGVTIPYSLAKQRAIVKTHSLFTTLANDVGANPGGMVQSKWISVGQRDGWIPVPADPAFGPAAGRYIPGELAPLLDIKKALRGDAVEGLVNRVFKTNVVTLNPVAWLNNFKRNWKGMVLSGEFSLYNPARYGAALVDAMQELQAWTKNPAGASKYIKDMEALGGLHSGMGQWELLGHGKEVFTSLRKSLKGAQSGFSVLERVVDTVSHTTNKVREFGGAVMDMGDKIHQVAVYKSAYKKAIDKGMAPDQAARVAMIRVKRFFADFQSPGKLAASVRSSPLGAAGPFTTSVMEDWRVDAHYVSELFGKLGPRHALSQWGKLVGNTAALTGAVYATDTLRRARGISDDEVHETLNARSAAQQAHRPFLRPLPWRDEKGRVVFYDWTGFLPEVKIFGGHPDDAVLQSVVSQVALEPFRGGPVEDVLVAGQEAFGLKTPEGTPPGTRPGEGGWRKGLEWMGAGGAIPRGPLTLWESWERATYDPDLPPRKEPYTTGQAVLSMLGERSVVTLGGAGRAKTGEAGAFLPGLKAGVKANVARGMDPEEAGKQAEEAAEKRDKTYNGGK